MGGGRPNYRRFKSFIADVSAKESKIRREEIKVKDGHGKYPDCLKTLPYDFCPKPDEVPKDPINVHQFCKTCQEHFKSKFYAENLAMKIHKERINRFRESGLPTKIESKV